MRGRTVCVLLVTALIACGPPPRRGGGGDDDGADGGDLTGDGNNGCAMGTELVYTIDQNSFVLSQFNPATKVFIDLGQLNCPSNGATPFSMSVDRSGNAWVLYTSGDLFKVPINGLQCTKTPWTAQNGLKVFGMGFSTDAPGGTTETLFVGGGMSQAQTSYTLAKLDTVGLTASPIGMQPALPEMTGTGNAELWGFFPEATKGRVVQFDKTNGSVLKSFDLPALAASGAGYAFAHWGGDFWVFLIKPGEPATKIYQVDRTTGLIESTTPTTNRTIVGAGVSTCAPTVIL